MTERFVDCLMVVCGMIMFIDYYLAVQSCVSTKGNFVIRGEERKLEGRIFPTYSLALRVS